MSAALAITGIGCIAAPGRGLDAQREALRAGRCHLSTGSVPGLPLAASLPIGRVTTAVPSAPGRTAALALAAASDALTDAGLDPAGSEIGVSVGSCTGGMPESEAAYLADAERVHAVYAQQEAHRCTDLLAARLGLLGPRSTHSVACASSACALAEAAEWIRSGLGPAGLVGGADALRRLTMAGFRRLQVIDSAGCRPLTTERAGMSLGEAGAALLLEDAAHARRRGARIRASLLGWGLRADAYHATAPQPDGSQLRSAIEAALADGGLRADAVAYVSAHGTGTRDNDACEATALGACFGRIPTASAKRSYGHTMGAAAAVELVACCLALEAGCAWPSAGAELGTPLTEVEVLTATRPLASDVICSTSLAFGGVNAALLLGGPARCT
jgi:3-oxoacyl-[acyl-carrier-protein] synthase II